MNWKKQLWDLEKHFCIERTDVLLCPSIRGFYCTHNITILMMMLCLLYRVISIQFIGKEQQLNRTFESDVCMYRYTCK